MEKSYVHSSQNMRFSRSRWKNMKQNWQFSFPFLGQYITVSNFQFLVTFNWKCTSHFVATEVFFDAIALSMRN